MAEPLDIGRTVKLKQLKYSGLFPNTHIYGFETVMNNLNIELERIGNASMRGLIECAIEIRRDTEKSSPKTPVDLGNLRASWFVVTAGGKQPDDRWNTGFRNDTSTKRRKTNLEGSAAKFMSDRTSAISEMTMKAKSFLPAGKQALIMGYSANYALYVHENMAANFKRQGAGAKWFQESVYRNTGRMLGIIKKNIQVR
jgi:hypothetical protein